VTSVESSFEITPVELRGPMRKTFKLVEISCVGLWNLSDFLQ
jgi:hypothetical protein